MPNVLILLHLIKKYISIKRRVEPTQKIQFFRQRNGEVPDILTVSVGCNARIISNVVFQQGQVLWIYGKSLIIK